MESLRNPGKPSVLTTTLRGSGRAFLEDEMKYLFASIAYASFFACVGFAVYWLKSGWPLFALVFMPSMSTKGDKEVSK